MWAGTEAKQSHPREITSDQRPDHTCCYWSSSGRSVLLDEWGTIFFFPLHVNVCTTQVVRMCDIVAQSRNHHLDFLSVSSARVVLLPTITPLRIWGMGLDARSLINMINWGVTAPCNLIPANWDFSHISPEQNAFPNERGCFHSLICGQQQEPGPADLLGPRWSALSRTQLLVQLQWIAAHPLFSAGPLTLLRSRHDPTGGEQARVRTQSQQPWTGLHTSTLPSDCQPLLLWPGSGMAGPPVVSQGVSLLEGHCSDCWTMIKSSLWSSQGRQRSSESEGIAAPLPLPSNLAGCWCVSQQTQDQQWLSTGKQ